MGMKKLGRYAYAFFDKKLSHASSSMQTTKTLIPALVQLLESLSFVLVFQSDLVPHKDSAIDADDIP